MAARPAPAAAEALLEANLDLEGDDAEAAGQQLEAWERAYEAERTWEDLEEDDNGRLRAPDPTAGQRAKRRRLLDAAGAARIRRGMIRYLVLVVDLSVAATEARAHSSEPARKLTLHKTDLRPSRLALLSTLAPAFIRSFFAANPLSQLGLLLARQGLAERLTELGGAPEAHVAALKAALQPPPPNPPVATGAFSLQNAVAAAGSMLAGVPPYGCREVLVLQSALASCDPADMRDTRRACVAAGMRVSVVSLSAEVYAASKLAQETGGWYSVALSEAHLDELIMAHAPPPPALAAAATPSLVQMGFPQRAPVAAATYFCAGDAGEYVCPRCKGRIRELPGECLVCRLTLVSSPHLARSYHHLFPVGPFSEVTPEALQATAEGHLRRCFGCACALRGGEEGVVLACGGCANRFCFACDAFIHESLHNCPGCLCAEG